MTLDDGQIRVLLVDDQELVAETMSLMLSPQIESGWSFLHVANPLEAMDAIREFKPNVVLIDVTMPQMSGIELLGLIRGKPSNASLPVVIFSGEEDPKTKALAFENGANDYLVKRPTPSSSSPGSGTTLPATWRCSNVTRSCGEWNGPRSTSTNAMTASRT